MSVITRCSCCKKNNCYKAIANQQLLNLDLEKLRRDARVESRDSVGTKTWKRRSCSCNGGMEGIVSCVRVSCGLLASFEASFAAVYYETMALRQWQRKIRVTAELRTDPLGNGKIAMSVVTLTLLTSSLRFSENSVTSDPTYDICLCTHV